MDKAATDSLKLSLKKQKAVKEEEKEKEARKLVEVETSETGLVRNANYLLSVSSKKKNACH